MLGLSIYCYICLRVFALLRTETRIILWDCVMYWKMFKSAVLAREKEEFEKGAKKFIETGRFESILNIQGSITDEFRPTSGNISLRTIIKQRRQWALRAVRRNEGPNHENLKILNVGSGAVPALLELCLQVSFRAWSRHCDWVVCVFCFVCAFHEHPVA
jgi:hypothetical protein